MQLKRFLTAAAFAAAALTSGTTLIPASAQAAPIFSSFTSLAPATRLPTSGDFNNDGYADLAGIGNTGGIRVKYGAANGTFTDGQVVSVGTHRVTRVAVGDFNADGIDDIAVLGQNSAANGAFWGLVSGKSTGALTFSNSALYPANFLDLATADLNGDGQSELIFTGSYETTSNVAIDFLAIVDFSVASEHRVVFYSYDNSVAGSLPLVTGDFDRDGYADVALARGDILDIGYGNGQSNAPQSGVGYEAFRNSVELQGAASATHLASGDLTGDGFPEFVARSNGKMTVWRSPSEHTPQASQHYSYPLSGSGPVALADVDGDNAVDAITAYDSNSVRLYLGTGTGFFSAPEGLFASSSAPASIIPLDFNRDGRVDIAFSLGSNVLGMPNGTPFGPARGALISEVRFAGSSGGKDQYAQIYNPGPTALSLGGWQLRFAQPGVGQPAGRRVAFPEGTVVPPAGHMLVSTPPGKPGGYSLVGSGRTAFHMSDMAGGVALVDPTGTTRDAVGLVSQPGFSSGRPLADFSALGQGAFVRKYSGGVPVNTGDNASDFLQLDTASDGSSTSLLGAPRPDHLGSPTQKNAFLQSSLVDPSKPASQSPNRVVTAATANAPATLTVNRKITNCSGRAKSGAECANAATVGYATVTKLRFRITALSTVQPNVPAGTAILKAVASADATPGGIEVKGLPLDSPSPASGGGINATFTATALIPQGLAPGQSVNVAFTFKVQQAGNFTFAFNTEDDLIPEGATVPSTPAVRPIVGRVGVANPLRELRVDEPGAETPQPAQAPAATPAPQATLAPPGPVVPVPATESNTPAVETATETIHGTIPASAVSAPLSGPAATPSTPKGKATPVKSKKATCKAARTTKAKSTKGTSKSKKATAKPCTTKAKPKTSAKKRAAAKR